MTIQTKITRSDIKIFPSERLTDNDDGGGLPLGIALDGGANELFNPIPSIAWVNGGFYVRLTYHGVQRLDDEPLIGAFSAITKPTNNENVSYLLFPATKFGETRKEVLQRIEAYSVATIESRMTLLSTQSKNSKIVQAYQRLGEPLPMVGDVYALTQDKDGYEQAEQYIQVTRRDSEERKFTSPSGKDFTRTVVKMEISSKLETDFVGIDYPSELYVDNACKIRETHVADAAQYYGVSKLAEAISKAKQQIKIPSLMAKLAPTNLIEQRLPDLSATGQRQLLFDACKANKDGILTLTVNEYYNINNRIYVGNAMTPGSIVVNFSDNRQIKDKSGTLMLNEQPVGFVTYSDGTISFTDSSFSGYIKTVDYRVAASQQRVSDSTKIDVTINNRSYNYTLTIFPSPAVGSVQISYRSQGRWYDLYDNGDGVLRGVSAAHGSGNVDFTMGTISISCGELPDVDSSIIIMWTTQANYFNRADSIPTSEMVLTPLAEDAVPESLQLNWQDDNNIAKQANCDDKGKITGDWTGRYDVDTRQIHIDASAGFEHPANKVQITLNYNIGEKSTETLTAGTRNGSDEFELTLSQAPKPHSLLIEVNMVEDSNATVKTTAGKRAIIDNGAGNLVFYSPNNSTAPVIGSVDYTTGTISFNPDGLMTFKKAQYISMGDQQSKLSTIHGSTGGSGRSMSIVRSLFTGYETVTKPAVAEDDADIVIRYFSSSTANSKTQTVSSGDIEISLLDSIDETIAPSSVNFEFSGKTYFDRQGSLFTDLDINTGSATLVGTLNYSTRKAILTNWTWQSGQQTKINALASYIPQNPIDGVTFRTTSSPIRSESLQIRATALDGSYLTAIASGDGTVKSDNIEGVVEVETGVADIRFGKMVNAAEVQDEPWFDINNVVNGQIWQSKHVFAETITYNAVAYSNLPIDSSVVKIDTVRLPQDGRIPIFRRGDTILITNQIEQEIGSAHTGGQTVPLSRGNLDRICLKSADNKPIGAEYWDYDLENGTITWKTPLDLSSYQMPVTAIHTQEELNRIHVADIDGTLSLQFATVRDYPIENTYVSSVLNLGDLQVGHSIPFTQRNWNQTWSDEPIGNQLLTKLNLKDYPMVLTDDGAITERWLIKFSSGSQFELYGEATGYVGKFDITTDFAPINPATSKPYFTLKKEAFGGTATTESAWSSQDIIRFNTTGTLAPIWVLCAVQPSRNKQVGDDGFTQCLYGDTSEDIT